MVHNKTILWFKEVSLWNVNVHLILFRGPLPHFILGVGVKQYSSNQCEKTIYMTNLSEKSKFHQAHVWDHS